MAGWGSGPDAMYERVCCMDMQRRRAVASGLHAPAAQIAPLVWIGRTSRLAIGSTNGGRHLHQHWHERYAGSSACEARQHRRLAFWVDSRRGEPWCFVAVGICCVSNCERLQRGAFVMHGMYVPWPRPYVRACVPTEHVLIVHAPPGLGRAKTAGANARVCCRYEIRAQAALAATHSARACV